MTMIKSGLARARSAAARRLQPSPPPPAAPVVVNQVPDPGFRAGLEGIYVHTHATCELVEVPGLPGVIGARVEGVNDNNDTHIAPDGRNAPGMFRLGMRAGGTYTASVSVFLPEPLTGSLNSGALRLIPGCSVGGSVRWSLAQSSRARNEYGHHRISVTFTVPADATAAWIRLHSGMSAGHGIVYWYSYSLVEGDRPVDYFDGDTTGDDFFAYAWTGEANASPSTRTLRVAEGVAPTAIAEEAIRRAGTAEGEALIALVDGDRLTEARVAAARGDIATARAGLRKVVKAGDPDGAAAYALGLIALDEHAWESAAKWLRAAVEKEPGEPQRAYRLAFAYDKLKRRDESKRTAAAGLQHDGPLPFDGPAVLNLDVKCFGARREVGLFLADHLDQIRVQTEQRLALPAVTALDQPIFVYWGQGFDQAPPLVRACVEALEEANPNVHRLTDANIGYYVDVPDDLLVALGGNKTHLSDLLRLLLLEKFGGVWVDGTCWVSEPLRPHIEQALKQGSVFAFNYHGPYISSWLLAARRGSYAVHLWRAAMFLWWEKRGELIDYFLLHHFFEMLHHLDDRFRAEWDEGQRLSSGPPHALQTAMLQPYDPARLREITAASFVHKLRYKYQPHEVTSDSYLAHVIRHDLP
jgi:hypothetical protein